MLIGDVLVGADEQFVSPNGIELRLGGKVRFMSTGETKTISRGKFINVHPGESVMIVSLESLNFKKEVVHKYFPHCALMALITPTTTMMREGMIQCSTKVHAGYAGELNWSFRNSSPKDFLIQQGEPLFNLTLLLLEGDEVPDIAYGDKDGHKYQNTSGIMASQRRIPADIPKDQIISSSFTKLDPKTQLREAGPPFSYIGNELVDLHGKWELVSHDVKILTEKMDDTKTSLLEKVDSVFEKKITTAVAMIVGAIAVLYGLLTFLQSASVPATAIAALAMFSGIVIPLSLWYVRNK